MIEHLKALARYNCWMNGKLYAVAATLSDAARKQDRGAFFGSIHGTLNHILLADRTWMLRFTGDRSRFVSRDDGGAEMPVAALSQILYDDFIMLTHERQVTDRQILDWVLKLDPALPESELSYRNMSGAEQHHVAWWAFVHFFNHQTHHRGQLTTLLMQAGKDPGVMDLIYMLRSEPARV